MERELTTVLYVFVEFVEGKESGGRNHLECGIRNPFNVTCWSILYSFILSLLAETQFALGLVQTPLHSCAEPN